jgi:hypothetical protein
MRIMMRLPSYLTFIGICLFSLPISAGQVAVINPNSGYSVSYGPAPSVSTAAPPSTTNNISTSVTPSGSYASRSMTQIEFQEIFSGLVKIDISGFTEAQVSELLSSITRIESAGILNDLQLKLITQEKQRLLNLQR